MESTRTSIFTFDHGQKKLNKAIGVEECFLDDLQTQMADVLRNHLFDENKDVKPDLSPSMLVESCLHEFSYSQLVVMASFFLQNKLDEFAERMKKKVNGLKAQVTKISLDSDDVPQEIKDLLEKLSEESKFGGAIDGDSLPQPIKDFLRRIVEESGDDTPDGDGDND